MLICRPSVQDQMLMIQVTIRPAIGYDVYLLHLWLDGVTRRR